uniref:Transcription factor E4F1 n=1 Tax=Nothoprocta perdicaria TaxID=30464 RepID=A0A8C6ZVA3_NOTPE
MRAPRGAAAILILQRGQQVGYAINVVIGNEALPVGTAALQVALHVLQRGDPREGEQCGEAAAVAHEDVGVQPVAHHDGARGVDVELAHHAVEHVAVGLAHDEGLALRRRLHGLHQAAGACGERGEAQPAAAAAGSAAAGTRSWVLGTQAGEGRCYSAKVVFCKEHNCLRVLSLDSGHIKEVIVAGEHVFENPNGSADGDVAEEPGNPDDQEQDLSTELIKVKLLVNKDGRYVCELCQKTFKTASILKAHMITHSSRKDYECKLCGTSFRTKGSLIRHHRRHTDERPYKCKKCGKSFRESGALTRHLKSLTPCTEKIRFNVNKEIVVNKDDLPAGSCSSNTDTVSSIASESMESPPVIHLVTDAKGNVLHEVHVQMQELLALTAPPPEEQPCEGEVHSENLLRQAMRNSGLVVERVAVEDLPKPEEPAGAAAEELENEAMEQRQPFLALICINHMLYFLSPDNKPFKCEKCGKEFTKGYLLKKHQEVHVNEWRFRCGECGKLYKTIAHVKGHHRVHSDERPYPCPKCGKRYKTKNAQQVHYRTHLEDKPYVCQYCSRGFREKGSLVRHIRHHTGEKPFKCYKCGRGFAEHGTLNRHLKTKGGRWQLMVPEESQSADNLAATVISEDPHTVLVEFSSVVADTQEYIIEVRSRAESWGVLFIKSCTGVHAPHLGFWEKVK